MDPTMLAMRGNMLNQVGLDTDSGSSGKKKRKGKVHSVLDRRTRGMQLV